MTGDNAGMGNTVPASRSFWTSEGLRWAIVTLLIPFAGFVWNEVQEREVERQKELERVRAEEQARVADARSESDIVIKLLPALSSGEDGSPMRGIALAVLLNLADRKALSPELASSVQVAVVTAQERLRQGKATEAERAALIKIASASDRPSASTEAATPPDHADPAVPPPPRLAQTFQVQAPRVYIHVFDEADRKRAQDLRDWCTRSKPWLVPGIENVATTASRTNRRPPKGRSTASVLFFNDEDRPRAEEIARRLLETGEAGAVAQFVKMDAPSGQIEVWFPLRIQEGAAADLTER